MTTLDQRSLRDAFSVFPTGVTVVTCMDADARPLGFTANSFASVSLDPPLLLICLAKTSYNYDVFTNASGFAINVLAESQKNISNLFAKPVSDRFATVDWRVGPNGAPILGAVAAWFDCSMHEIIDSGDHAILIGEVKGFDSGLANGLGFARGSYFTASLADRAVAAAASEAEVRIAALIERDDEVLLFADDRGRYLLPNCKLSDQESSQRLRDFVRDTTGLSVAVGQIYSVYQDRQNGLRYIIYHCVAEDGDVAKGAFYRLSQLKHLPFVSSAIDDTLKRFSSEVNLGNFGIYFGTEMSGTVHKLSKA